MHVLGVELTVTGVLLDVKSTVGNVVPAGFGLIGKHDVSAVVPLEPSRHLLRKSPNAVLVRAFVEPVIKRAFERVGPGVDVSGEASVESGNDVVESKGIGREVHPS